MYCTKTHRVADIKTDPVARLLERGGLRPSVRKSRQKCGWNAEWGRSLSMTSQNAELFIMDSGRALAPLNGGVFFFFLLSGTKGSAGGLLFW
ncbi:hypothetical protein BDV32DRAFT_128692 [Aspergillus pseudonomiae]|nr:hypothetical protein BDV32DRAFT_128692 [Aspergillus pseudonomiae]